MPSRELLSPPGLAAVSPISSDTSRLLHGVSAHCTALRLTRSFFPSFFSFYFEKWKRGGAARHVRPALDNFPPGCFPPPSGRPHVRVCTYVRNCIGRWDLALVYSIRRHVVLSSTYICDSCEKGINARMSKMEKLNMGRLCKESVGNI